MRVMHKRLWMVSADADPAMNARAQEKVANFKEILPGCLEATGAPLYVPEMSEADQKAFGAAAGFEEMAHGYNYIIYNVFESEAARQVYEEHPAHMDRRDECLAIRVGDASEALAFELRSP